LTPKERNRAILGFHARHPDWTQRQIADAMSISQMTVHNLVSMESVKQSPSLEKYFSSETTLPHVSDTHLMQVAPAPAGSRH